MSAPELTTGNNEWEICIGNGWAECPTAVSYVGMTVINGTITTGTPTSPSPTAIPTPVPNVVPTAPTPSPFHSQSPNSSPPPMIGIIIPEVCNVPVTVEFGALLKGEDFVTASFPGDGKLTFVNISMYFGGAFYSSAEWASDMLLEVKNDKSGQCVFIGGFDYYTEACSYLGAWPSDWDTTLSGTHTAQMNVSSLAIGGNSSYTVTIANGYDYGETAVQYNGSVVLDFLLYNCYIPPDQYIEQTYNEIDKFTRINYELRLNATQKMCAELTTSIDNVLENILVTKEGDMEALEFDANGLSGAWASDLFVTVEVLEGGSTEDQLDCIQYGGFDWVVPGCTLMGRWPEDWQSDSKNGGSAVTPSIYDNQKEFEEDSPGGGDVSAAMLKANKWRVCIGNGWRESGGIATYKGDMRFVGPITIAPPPTFLPTAQPTGAVMHPVAFPTQAPSAPTVSKSPSSSVPSSSRPSSLPSSSRPSSSVPSTSASSSSVPSSSVPTTSVPSSSPTSVPSSSGPSSAPTSARSSAPTIWPTNPPTAVPTGQVEDLQITSSYNQTVQLSYNLIEIGGQSAATTFLANGNIIAINVTLYFGGASPNSGEWASDLLIVIFGPNKKGVQIGGYDVYVPDCIYGGAWPASWDTSLAGYYTHYQELTEFEDASIPSGDGTYQITMENGYVYGLQPVSYQGVISIVGLLDMEPDVESVAPTTGPTPTPSLAPTALLAPSRPPFPNGHQSYIIQKSCNLSARSIYPLGICLDAGKGTSMNYLYLGTDGSSGDINWALVHYTDSRCKKGAVHTIFTNSRKCDATDSTLSSAMYVP